MPEGDCGDCIDNDCDGAIDSEDMDCTSAEYAAPFESDCGDGVDNDGDGLVDGDDPDCAMNLYGVPF